VHQALLVDVVQDLRYRPEEGDRRLAAEDPSLLPVGPQELTQGEIHKLHSQERVAARRPADLVNLAHIAVADVGRQTGLAVEVLEQLRVTPS
jgi:hypothetical protein